MISTIELEKCVAGTSIFGIVIDKLCYKKKPCSIILLEVDKGLEANFYHTILPLNLVIYLRIEGSEESPFDAKKIA